MTHSIYGEKKKRSFRIVTLLVYKKSFDLRKENEFGPYGPSTETVKLSTEEEESCL